jgi:N-acetylglucosamine kinase-like BadF-type ATPase
MEEKENQKTEIYLGVDGGQSHTEAVIADENGNILGRGFGGASNHAEIPGGRERLRNAVIDSVGAALKISNSNFQISDLFASAHFGMTGGAEYKEEIIGEIIKATYFKVGHDAPTALFGATAGKPGIVVIAGTGSVVYGENGAGETARAGGLGYLFSDEGSGFGLAARTIRLAIKEYDGIIEKDGLLEIVLNFFERDEIRRITDDFYNGKISRDEIAKLARYAHDAARNGNETLQREIGAGVEILAQSVKSVAEKLNFRGKFPVVGVGGMFNGTLFKKMFVDALKTRIPKAVYGNPRFGPAVGALLLAYRQANIEITEDLLKHLEKPIAK